MSESCLVRYVITVRLTAAVFCTTEVIQPFSVIFNVGYVFSQRDEIEL